jgi:DnaD and phage-associated domain
MKPWKGDRTKMKYSMNLGAWNSVFAVPSSVVDTKLKMADKIPLKVLLWALRHAGEPFEPDEVAQQIDSKATASDVYDAMLYWQQEGVINIRGGEIVPGSIAETEPPLPEKAPEPEKAEENPPEEKARKVLSRPQKADNAFVAKRMSESTEIACLMQEAQQILGRLISNGDSATLLMIHDDFGLPADVIIMLLQYVVSIGKANTRYIEKAAMNWADEEIFTHEKAEEKLRRLAENSKAWHLVEQAVGMPHRAPSTKEENAASVWVNDWGFSIAMIHEAYDRSVDSTGKFTMPYMNRILERWHKEGVSTLEQAQKEKEERTASRKSGEKTQKNKNVTFDIEEYERTSMYDTLDKG